MNLRRRHKRVVASMIATTVVFCAGAGCALVIDLGDESKLRPAEAGGDSGRSSDDTGVVDSGAPDVGADSGEEFVCGLRQSSNKACRDCVQKNPGGCCEESKACAEDPDCVSGLECIKDCMVQFNCISTCFGNPTLQTVTFCSQNNCGAFCVPGAACERLGSCGVLFADAGGELVIRTIVRNVILDVDETKCKAQHREMHKYSAAKECQCSDAGECD